MAFNPEKPGISGWSFDRLLTTPQLALDAMDEAERNRIAANRRIAELLEANNRYLNEARDARAELKALRERILGYRD
jgi:hypothetical protein